MITGISHVSSVRDETHFLLQPSASPPDCELAVNYTNHYLYQIELRHLSVKSRPRSDALDHLDASQSERATSRFPSEEIQPLSVPLPSIVR